MKKFKKIITFGIVTVLSIGMLTGCGLLDSEVNELNGTIKIGRASCRERV